MAGHHIGVLALICSFLLVLPLWSENIQSNAGDDKPMVNNDETPIIEELKKGRERNAGEPHGKSKKRKTNKKIGNRKKKENKYTKKNKYKNNSTRAAPACFGTASQMKCCTSKSPCPEKHGDCDYNVHCAGSLRCGRDNCKDFHSNAKRTADCCIKTGPGIGGRYDWEFCTKNDPCQEKQGNCEEDYECATSLICGHYNCKDFHHSASRWSNCCIKDNCGKEYTQRIIGGSETAENKYSWMVRFPQGCGGSLITDRHILTARHCLCWDGHHSNNNADCFIHGICTCNNANYQWIPTMSEVTNYWRGKKVKVGVHDQTARTDYQEVAIKEVKWPKGDDHDFAMVILNRAVDLTDGTIGTVCLPSGQITDYKGKWGLALGWGDTIDTGKGESAVLKQLWLKVSQYEYGPKYLDTDIDKGNKKHQSTCDGDSGGPLLYRNMYTRKWTIIGTLHGKVNYNGGKQTCLMATANVWNKIAAHLDWIKKIVKK